MKNSVITQQSERLFWPDFLRAISCMAVVLIHVTSIGVNNYDAASQTYQISSVLGNLFRWAVPIFFMVSGMFLLDPAHEMPSKKLKAKVLSLCLIIVFWSIFFSLLEDISNHTLTVKSIAKAVLYCWKGTGYYHLWFLYPLLFLYLMLPLFRVITKNASTKVLQWSLLLWFLFSLCVETINSAGEVIPALSVLNVHWAFEGITTYAGYFLLGYVLSKARPKSKAPFGFLVLLLTAVSVGLSIVGIRFLDGNTGVFFDGKTLFPCICAVALFLVCKDWQPRDNWFRKVIHFIAENSLGIYLIHTFWLTLFHKILGIDYMLLGPVSILVWLLAVFGASLLSSYVLKKIPYVKRLVSL